MKLACMAIGFLTAVPAFASPGSVDRFDCHQNQDTHEYHCHGALEAAKKRHLLIGGQFTAVNWRWDDGPANNFVGPAVTVEWALDSIALRGTYGYSRHLTGDTDFGVSGWDLGLKLGSGLARVGNHLFIQAGYAAQRLNYPDKSFWPFGGISMGVGWVRVSEKFAFDATLLYQDSGALEQLWEELNFPGEVLSLKATLGFYLRF
ncbi:hypothetical protein [Reinekea sp.]|jgi:hypothetical protein|uniref:hypothetical protein n=1 Tax=Reinekea sp. TaxID=1970455 RepID=UPI002A820F10|nr:hypothetical protein [Reinekea sp.]